MIQGTLSMKQPLLRYPSDNENNTVTADNLETRLNWKIKFMYYGRLRELVVRTAASTRGGKAGLIETLNDLTGGNYHGLTVLDVF